MSNWTLKSRQKSDISTIMLGAPFIFSEEMNHETFQNFL